MIHKKFQNKNTEFKRYKIFTSRSIIKKNKNDKLSL